MKNVFAVVCLLWSLSAAHSFAASAIWRLNPPSGDWNTAGNWTPATVPNGSDQTAFFSVSNITNVEVPTFINLRELVFQAGADPFTITIDPHETLKLFAGVRNDSGIDQTIFVSADPQGTSGLLEFLNATAGTQMTYITEGNFVANLGNGGVIAFFQSANARANNFINRGATVAAGFGGRTAFSETASAGSSIIVNEGGAVSGAFGGVTSFDNASMADTSLITAQGGLLSGAKGGQILLVADEADAGTATLIATGGINGGDGGQIVIGRGTRTRRAQFKIYGNGSLDIGGHRENGARAGSLEGDGLVFLGANNFAIGVNDLNTTFAGTIMDGGIVNGVGGSVTKLGQGSLELSGANGYTGGTTLRAGRLIISNTIGSGTGAGPVTVETGTLGGKGIIAGPTTIGTGSVRGSFLQPDKGASTPTTLTFQSTLTFRNNSIYIWKLNTNTAKADQVVANGVTIESGGRFDLRSVADNELTVGTVFTAISNTSASPISGTFSNLPDGATVTVDLNNFQVSYEGGDGNDLTLTVIH